MRMISLFIVFLLVFGCISPRNDSTPVSSSDGQTVDSGAVEQPDAEDLTGVSVGEAGQEITAGDIPDIQEEDEELDTLTNEFNN